MEDRIITFENQNKNLIINQNLDIGYAGSVWDASLVLVYFFKKQIDLYNNIKIENRIFFPKDKIFLELGAATGVNGFTCGILGAKKIYLTDKGGCCEMLKKNYEINKNTFNDNFECIIQELDWTCDKERNLIKDKCNLDYIIGSDLVWNPKLREPLANTIKYFMKLNKNIKCFFSFEIRDNEVNNFFELFDKNEYKIEKIKDELFDELYKSDEIIIVVITNIIKEEN